MNYTPSNNYQNIHNQLLKLEIQIKELALKTFKDSIIENPLIGDKYIEVRNIVEPLLKVFSDRYIRIGLPLDRNELFESEYYLFSQFAFDKYINLIKFISEDCCG